MTQAVCVHGLALLVTHSGWAPYILVWLVRSYKGSNIALMIELLAGPLVGGAVLDKLGNKNWGNLMIALNPSIMGNPSTIAHNVQLMLDRVKGARKASGVAEIMLPGQRGNRLAGRPHPTPKHRPQTRP